MNKQDIYRRLEEKMLDYEDYANVPLAPTAEELVAIPKSGDVIGRQIDKMMYPYTGETVFVRWSVLQKLREAAKLLGDYSENCRLEVVYGYRAPEVQRRLFEEHKERLREEVEESALDTATHRVIALPEVAGHPTGGAVDIQILSGPQALDMGTPIWDFVSDSFTFSPFIGKEAWRNRQLLRRIMTAVGFAPFDGEWWHFSYGDKEWARYYAERAAIYEQVTFTSTMNASQEPRQ
jgi:D-alanyl-D-alanine dipeptidase